jgi:hypothetical protein
MNKTTVACAVASVLIVAGCARSTHTREVVYTPATAPAPTAVAPAAAAPPPAVIVVEKAPPPPRVETPPAPPSQGLVWVPGYWNWTNGQYEWVAGYWEPERVGYTWVPHKWEMVDGRWLLSGGTWVRQ